LAKFNPAAGEKGEGGDKDKDKPDDKDKADGPANGPLYDPEDNMGGVSMSVKLEERFTKAREVLQAMMLRHQVRTRWTHAFAFQRPDKCFCL
jgi:hypothetical protein